MSKLAAVMIGGALGAAMRFWLSSLPGRWFSADFPLGTLLVNLIGAFLIGILYIAADTKTLHPTLSPLLITGFLGALTTFSTFALDKLILIENGRWHIALLYLLLSISLGLALVFAGASVGRYLFDG